ncbi:MAG: hypothetical protein C4324_12085 [Blastocatellia bacterium]
MSIVSIVQLLFLFQILSFIKSASSVLRFANEKRPPKRATFAGFQIYRPLLRACEKINSG